MNLVYFKAVDDFSDAANRIFKEQKKRILEILPNAEVLHVGSTAVPGSLTKGDLDLSVRISKDNFEGAYKKLKTLYAVDPNNKKTDIIASFKDENQEIPLGIQVTVIGSEHDNFHAHTRAFLNDPKLVQKYNQLKLSFEGKDMDEYRKAKNKFFEKIKKHG